MASPLPTWEGRQAAGLPDRSLWQGSWAVDTQGGTGRTGTPDVLRRQGEDPRALKSEQRQTIQRTGAVTFQKAAEEWLAASSSKLAATTLKDYKNKLQNQILPVFGKRSIRAITRSECLDFKRTIEARGARNQSDKVFGVLRQVFPMPSTTSGSLTPTPPGVPDTPTRGMSPRVTRRLIGTMCLGSWRISPATGQW